MDKITPSDDPYFLTQQFQQDLAYLEQKKVLTNLRFDRENKYTLILYGQKFEQTDVAILIRLFKFFGEMSCVLKLVYFATGSSDADLNLCHHAIQ